MEPVTTEQRARVQADLDDRTRQLQSWRKAYQVLVAEYELTEPDPAILRYHLDRLKGMAEAFPEHRVVLEAQADEIVERYKRMSSRYESILRERCESAGYSVTSRAPDLIVEGLVKVQLDSKKNAARVNGKRVAPMAVTQVVEEIAKEVERLWGRSFETVAFVAMLRAAHIQTAGPNGGPVPAKVIYDVLAAGDKSYRSDMFAADLARLGESGVARAKDGSQVVLGPSRDTRQAIWVVNRRGDSSGRYIGLIDFK